MCVGVSVESRAASRTHYQYFVTTKGSRPRENVFAPVSTIVASYYADDGHVTVAATGLAVILLGGLALVGSALQLREAWQAGRPEGWRAELMEFLEDDLANFVAVMQGAPSQPERARPLSSVSQKGRNLRGRGGNTRIAAERVESASQNSFLIPTSQRVADPRVSTGADIKQDIRTGKIARCGNLLPRNSNKYK